MLLHDCVPKSRSRFFGEAIAVVSMLQLQDMEALPTAVKVVSGEFRRSENNGPHNSVFKMF